MGIYIQKSSKSLQIDFRLRFEGPGVVAVTYRALVVVGKVDADYKRTLLMVK